MSRAGDLWVRAATFYDLYPSEWMIGRGKNLAWHGAGEGTRHGKPPRGLTDVGCISTVAHGGKERPAI